MKDLNSAKITKNTMSKMPGDPVIFATLNES